MIGIQTHERPGIAMPGYGGSPNIIAILGGGCDDLAYDANGNLTTDDQGRTLLYDAWNRLVEVKGADGYLLAAYTYDGLGRRVTEVSYSENGSLATHHLYYNTNSQVLTEAGDNLLIANIWSPVYTDALLFRRKSDTGDNYVTQDANFNVTSIEYNGYVDERFVYNAYGQFAVMSNNWTPTTDTRNWVYTFQGLRWDTAAGVFYARARTYSPTLMRWTEWDPLGYPDGMNTYAAYAANPINRRDPMGTVVLYYTGGPFPAASDPLSDKIKAEVLKVFPVEDVIVWKNDSTGAGLNKLLDSLKKNPCQRVIIAGYSYGGQAAVDASRRLDSMHIKVDALLTVDSVDKPFQDAYKIPSNVTFNENWYQKQDILHGEPNTGGNIIVNHEIPASAFSFIPFVGPHLQIDGIVASDVAAAIVTLLSI